MSLRTNLLSTLGAASYKRVSLRAQVIRSRKAAFRGDDEGEGDADFTPRRGRWGVIMDALEYRQAITFFYQNNDGYTGRRIVQPHSVYKTKTGVFLLAWALARSASEDRKDLPGWRMYRLTRIRNARLSIRRRGNNLIKFRIRRGYRRFRRGRHIKQVKP